MNRDREAGADCICVFANIRVKAEASERKAGVTRDPFFGILRDLGLDLLVIFCLDLLLGILNSAISRNCWEVARLKYPVV